jgi:hypothetical protein
MLDNLVRDLVKILLNLLVLKSTTNQTLGGKQGILWVDNSLSLGGSTNKSLTILGEGDNRWSGTGTLCVFNDLGDLSLHNSNSRVGGTKINTNDGTLDLAVTI